MDVLLSTTLSTLWPPSRGCLDLSSRTQSHKHLNLGRGLGFSACYEFRGLPFFKHLQAQGLPQKTTRRYRVSIGVPFVSLSCLLECGRSVDIVTHVTGETNCKSFGANPSGRRLQSSIVLMLR